MVLRPIGRNPRDDVSRFVRAVRVVTSPRVVSHIPIINHSLGVRKEAHTVKCERTGINRLNLLKPMTKERRMSCNTDLSREKTERTAPRFGRTDGGNLAQTESGSTAD